VLLHPLKPGEVVRSSNEVGADVAVFHETLGITGGREALEKKRWFDAAGEARDAVRDTGTAGVQATVKAGVAGVTVVGKLGEATAGSAKAAAARFTGSLRKRTGRNDEGERPPLDE
jgi:hypothetical protein